MVTLVLILCGLCLALAGICGWLLTKLIEADQKIRYLNHDNEELSAELDPIYIGYE